MVFPSWFSILLLSPISIQGQEIFIGKEKFILKDHILREVAQYSGAQSQTQTAFSFKWSLRNTFDSEASLTRMRNWLFERYGHPHQYTWLRETAGTKPIVLDAGCGAGFSGMEYFGPVWNHIHYIGVDISSAVDVALQRAHEKKYEAIFIQVDLNHIPFRNQSLDVIFSEGVLHHTDNTEKSFSALIPLLKKGGRIMFYVYKKKGPIREFTDDYIREKLQKLSPEDAWKALEPLTSLGVTLGKMKIQLTLDKPIDILEIPAGSWDLQRFFYWHIAKMYYRDDLSFDELNHINFDWYYPKNAHRHTPEEVRTWCANHNLEIERENIQESGITIIARKS